MKNRRSIFKVSMRPAFIAGIFAFTLCFGVLITSVQAAVATPPVIAGSACDPEYFKSMKSRAWLEAQREITQNQNLIFKPDSVLEYTCFNRQLTPMAANETQLFSGGSNGRWPVNVGNMAGTLTNLVLSPTTSYIAGNFAAPSDKLLGGRSDNLDSSSYGLGTPLSNLASGTYECDIMNRVWLEAKCMDFINNADNDGFYTFDEYSTSPDKRFLPAMCSAVLNIDNSNKWQTQMQTATQADFTPWVEDTVKTYMQYMSYTGGAAGVPIAGAALTAFCANITPVETGLMVRDGGGGAPVAEKRCVPQACDYSYSADACVPH